MIGGNSDNDKIAEAFSKIKEDMAKLNEEMYNVKQDHKRLLEENIVLKKQISGNILDKDTISQVVRETLRHHKPKESALMKKFNKKRKGILTARITNLATQKKLTLPEIKEVVVDQEALCSKATFYRYIDRMKKKDMISFVNINDMEVVVKT